MTVTYEIWCADAAAPDVLPQHPGWEWRVHPAGGSVLRAALPAEAELPQLVAHLQHAGLQLTSLQRVTAAPAEAPDPTALIQLLEAKESLYQRMFEAGSEGMAIRTQDGVIIAVNPAFCRMYGLERARVIGTTTGGERTPEQQQIFEAYLNTLNAGKAFQISGWQHHAAGHLIHIELHAVPFTYRGVPYILDLARDTTEQVRAAEIADQRAAERARELATLLEVSLQVASTRDLEPLLRTVLNQLLVVLPFAAATFSLLVEPDRIELLLYDGPIAQAALPSGWRIGPQRPFGTPLADLIAEAEAAHPQAFGREVIYSGEPVIIPDVTADTPPARVFRQRLAALLGATPAYIGCWMGVPLIYRDEVIGMLDFDHEQPGAFSERHARLALAAASQAAIAIMNTRLLAEVQGAAALEERQRLARELHDAVTQQLFSASLIGEVLPQIWANNPAQAGEYLEDLRLLTKGALAEMRALLVELRPTAITDTPLPDLLQHLCNALSGRIRLPVELQTTGVGLLPPDAQMAFYRVAQEALQNVAKHARARRVEVRLTLNRNRARLDVQDDGRGFDPATVSGDHFGLTIMRERLTAIGGTIRLTSAPGSGTTLTAEWRRTG
jgi:two-component system nitrate/nitrite sensor histidine kinase NarX